MKRRKIVFVNQATGYLAIDIINAFAEKYDDVAFIYGDLRVQDVEPDAKTKRSKVIEKSRKSNLKRFRRWLIATVQIFFLLVTRYRKYEIFYFSVPPFAYFSSLFIRRKFSILMWDVYPDALKSAGINPSNFIYRLWTKINKRLFSRAHRIYTIGEGQVSLMSQYVDRDKVHVVHLWPGLRNASPIKKEDNPFLKEHDLTGKFIVEYSGNFGGTHNIGILVDAARMLLHDQDICFLFIGRGTRMEDIKDTVLREGLTNVKMLPFQADDVIKYSLAAADLSVVLIDDTAANAVVPSKVYNLLAVGSPLLCVSPASSELSRLVETYHCGKNFEANKVDSVVGFITEMKQSPRDMENYRSNSLRASEEFSPENAKKFLGIYLTEE